MTWLAAYDDLELYEDNIWNVNSYTDTLLALNKDHYNALDVHFTVQPLIMICTYKTVIWVW